MQALNQKIDLKPFIRDVRQRWWYLPLGGLFVMCLGLIWVTVIRTPIFKATALVAVTQARPAPRLDDVETVNNGQEPLGVIYNSLPQLAKSDTIMAKLLAETAFFADNEYPLISLHGAVEANPIMSPSLLALSVAMSDRDEATRLANRWAAIVIDEGNQLYDGYGQEQVVQYEAQLELIDAELIQAQEAFAEFESRNESVVLQNQLDTTINSHAEYLTEQQALMSLVQDVEAFIEQLQLRSTNETATLSDQVLLLAFQSRAYDVDVELPAQIGFSESGQGLGALTVGEHVEQLQSLVIIVDKLVVDLDKQISDLNPVITELQGQLQLVDNEADLLKRRVNVSGEARTALARKVEEARIAAETINRPLQIASSANLPELPVGPRKMLVVLTTGVVGVAFALLFLLARTWLVQTGLLLEATRNESNQERVSLGKS